MRGQYSFGLSDAACRPPTATAMQEVSGRCRSSKIRRGETRTCSRRSGGGFESPGRTGPPGRGGCLPWRRTVALPAQRRQGAATFTGQLGSHRNRRLRAWPTLKPPWASGSCEGRRGPDRRHCPRRTIAEMRTAMSSGVEDRLCGLGAARSRKGPTKAVGRTGIAESEAPPFSSVRRGFSIALPAIGKCRGRPVESDSAIASLTRAPGLRGQLIRILRELDRHWSR